jgi:formyl-CoA transferase/CoA:oxalate CoA-transferase
MIDGESGKSNATPPLGGIRVLDFTNSLAGPHCTWLLSCLGAEVVKVEPPKGDYFRASAQGSTFANANRNKRSLVLDLNKPADQKAALALSSRYDVIVENFKPGTMERFGLSYDTVHAANPGVIYASVSGFGQYGPSSRQPGYDVIAQAVSGMMAATGEEGGGAVRVGTAPIDYGTGAYTALAIVAAICRRIATGEGSRIDACLSETAMAWMSHHYTRFSITAEEPRRRGTANEAFVPYQMFEASDGAVFVGVASDRMFSRFCEAFDLHDLGADERFSTLPGRWKHRETIVDTVADRLRSLTTSEITKTLKAIDVPTAEVLTVSQAIDHPQARARDFVMTLRDATVGDILVTPFPVLMDGVPRIPGHAAPTLGQNTAEILDGLRETPAGTDTGARETETR